MIKVLLEILINNSDVAAIQSNRIYMKAIPQGDPYPATTMHLISTTKQQSKQSPGKVIRSRIQLDHYASTYLVADKLAKATRKAIEGRQQDPFINIIHENQHDGYDERPDIYRMINEFTVSYRDD